MSERRGVHEIPGDYQPVPREQDESTPTVTSCCRRPNCNFRVNDDQKVCCCSHGYIIPVFILFILVLIVLLLPWETINRNGNANSPIPVESPLPCQLEFVESLPLGLNYSQAEGHPQLRTTIESWQLLLGRARSSLDIVSPHWTLRGLDIKDSSTGPGDHLFQRLLSNGDPGKPKLRLRIVVNRSQDSLWHADARILANYGAADVVGINYLHSKLWLVDEEHFYLGSASMDWRSLTQRKELGILARNCPHLARDLAKIFKEYWYLGNNEVPEYWPWMYHTHINQRRPLLLNINKNHTMRAYLAMSPPGLAAKGRSHELDAILDAIDKASEFISISLMDYFPQLRRSDKVEYWPFIDNALRRAALERGVAIKLLISWWKYSDPSEDHFLRSLESLNKIREDVDVEMRRFVVPTTNELEKISGGRVSCNSYLVTDSVVFIGTSSWSGEHFTNSAGLGLVLQDMDYNNNSLRTDLLSIFQRDWFSPFALPLKPNLRI
ncbi:5'-3' exonuclease PLD3 [Drosophila ficusphila]|uniref:5'-3' exonuclease PLD3 n=1 Tax=Drosophila ficusphila TaxID=30025 RepID=UPI001C8A709B|nr:5'-3' exonuclease PLD3 [Drosophila ficusphila]